MGAVVIMALSPAVAPVTAWGAQGHHVVARLAWALMTPAAQDRAAALLDGRLDAFVASSTWADDVRSARPETYNWHFVNIPAGQARYDAARDCPSSDRGDCVIRAIGRARAELADPGRPPALRTEALKFLVHFVGDLHQPLHATDNHDRGGNDVGVAALRGDDGRPTNLHAAWDTGLINLSAETEAARADRLLARVKARPNEAGLDVVAWAEQSHAAAARVALSYPGFSPAGPPAGVVTLDEPYRARAMEAIDGQLALAGSRLAGLLNAILGEPLPDPTLIRIFVETEISGEAIDMAGKRQSVKDLMASFESRNHRKTLALVASAREADAVVAVVERSVVTPKFVMGLGPRPGETALMSQPTRTPVLRVELDSGGERLGFTNRNKPIESPTGWKLAADDVTGQIAKWAAAHREEILNRRAALFSKN